MPHTCSASTSISGRSCIPKRRYFLMRWHLLNRRTAAHPYTEGLVHKLRLPALGIQIKCHFRRGASSNANWEESGPLLFVFVNGLTIEKKSIFIGDDFEIIRRILNFFSMFIINRPVLPVSAFSSWFSRPRMRLAS